MNVVWTVPLGFKFRAVAVREPTPKKEYFIANVVLVWRDFGVVVPFLSVLRLLNVLVNQVQVSVELGQNPVDSLDFRI